MAKLLINNSEHEIPDGARIDETCENAGIPFSCNTGVCATCQILILEGHDNLGELTEEEVDLDMDRDTRLACQCIIKSGTVKVSY